MKEYRELATNVKLNFRSVKGAGEDKGIALFIVEISQEKKNSRAIKKNISKPIQDSIQTVCGKSDFIKRKKI